MLNEHISKYPTPEQKILYEQMKRAALAFIADEGMISASTVLTQIIRLQQVCSGFAKLDDGRTIEVPTNKYDFKLDYIFTEQGFINQN